MQRKEGVLSKLCWGAISTYELESLASWALASSVGPDCVIIQERTNSWDGKVHRGDNRTNIAWNRNRNERDNRKRNQAHIRNQLQQRGCQWIFKPPKASHASGVDLGKAHPQYSYRLTAILGNGLEALATSWRKLSQFWIRDQFAQFRRTPVIPSHWRPITYCCRGRC